MKRVRILFIVNEYRDEHLGLMYLSSMLKLHGYEPRVVRAHYDTIRDELSNNKNLHTVLAYSATSFSIEHYLKLNRRIKKDFDFISVFGGYYPTGRPHIIEEEGVDVVCIGEGEYPFLELVDSLNDDKDIRGIRNLWVKQNERIYKNPLRPLIRDLDALPFPDRNLFNEKSLYFYDRIYVMTSRGCTFRCPHCYNSTYRHLYEGEQHYRRRSVDNVIREIQKVKTKQPVKFILFYDDIFILNPDWLEEFSYKYRKEINIPFRCNIRIDLITPRIIKYLKEANCHNVSFGIETGDDELLKNVLRRNMTTQEIIQKAHLIKESGIKLRTTNMIGIPGGSISTDLKTIKLNIRCKVDYALVSMFRSYPKTTFSISQSDLCHTKESTFSQNIEIFSEIDDAGYLQRIPSSFCLPEFEFTSAAEKRMISNLHELFTVAVSFPFLLPIITILIRLPLKRFFIYINFLWAYYCSFFVLYPTCNFLCFFKRAIEYKIKLLCKKYNRKKICKLNDYVVTSPLFKFKNKAHIRLNKRQLFYRDRVSEKIKKGIYQLREQPCLCGSSDSIILSQTDRYGLPINFVMCKSCGLLRTNPRFEEKSLIEFYTYEYRNLFMESDNIRPEYFQRLNNTGEEITKLIKTYCPNFQLSGAKVLDIGCSSGGALVPFLKEHAVVKGFDYDKRYISYGNNYSSSLNLSFGGVSDLKKSKNEKYNIIICNHVLEHLAEPQAAVEILYDCLDNGGILYVGVPDLKNPAHYASPTKSFLGALHISHMFYFTRISLMRLFKDFTTLYADDQIRALFQKKEPHEEKTFISEYNNNLRFIIKYEKSLSWQIRRLAMLVREYCLIHF